MYMCSIRLASITIKNLRSIKDESFPLSDFTALIGYNNAGKTNILMGCRWLLSKYSLPINYFNDTKRPVVVDGLIVGINAESLKRKSPEMFDIVAPFLRGSRLKIRRVQKIPGGNLEHIELWVQRQFLRNNKKIREWEPAPYGFEEALGHLFPAPIQISDNSLGEDYDAKSYTRVIVGKLIAEILKPVQKKYADVLDNTLESLKDLLSLEGEERAPELLTFDRNLNSKMEPLFPSLKLKLQLQAPNLNDIFKQGTLKVIEENDGFIREIESLGMGAQRAVQMALVRHLAEVRKHSYNDCSCTLLLVDSPELFLHPQAVELVRIALKKLSTEGYQVIFATHSAQMVTSDDVNSSLLIRKNIQRGTHMRKRIEDAVRQVIEDAPSQLQMLFSLSNSNELLFADYVLLTEGRTELRILPHLFERVSGDSFALIKCALVRQGGVSNTRKSMAVLRAMDMPVRAIVDLDYAFTTAAHDGFLKRDDRDIEYCKNLFRGLALQERIRLVNGIPVNRNSSVSAADAYAMLAAMDEAQDAIENIHQKMLEKGIWVWKKGSIEHHLGLNGKNEHVWSNFIERLRRTNRPHKEVRDWEGVKQMVQWIRDGSPRD
ncbi:MAG: AAA family ATPase [Fibrobacter sp.]|nr:AAA family ATPase [Fibrobacter sp.]